MLKNTDCFAVLLLHIYMRIKKLLSEMTTGRLLTNYVFVVLVLVTMAGISSCAKEEGKGGLATIRGKVKAYDMNLLGDVVDSAYLPNIRVFISYGSHTWVDDDTRTSYTGDFAFEWLQKGNYTIWVVSECKGCPLDNKADTLRVHIDKRRETVVVRDLIYNY
jgi:hypothetical protein